MTIRISSIEQLVLECHYRWLINMKGIHGEGVYGQVVTGPDGHGLYILRLGATNSLILPPDRFYAHPGLTAEQVVHRVAACLVCIGWGDEDHEDREAITSGRPVRTRLTLKVPS